MCNLIFRHKFYSCCILFRWYFNYTAYYCVWLQFFLHKVTEEFLNFRFYVRYVVLLKQLSEILANESAITDSYVCIMK